MVSNHFLFSTIFFNFCIDVIVLLSLSLLFSQITVQDILEFEKKYKGSEEERKDVIQLYVQHEGNMDAITDSAMCCSQDDEPRLRGIIHAAIQGGEVTEFPAFTQETDKKKRARRKRVRNVLALKQQTPEHFSTHISAVIWLQLTFQADRERQEAEEMQKEIGLGDEDESLVMMLQVTKVSAYVWSCSICFSLLKPFLSYFSAKTEVQRAEFHQFPFWPGGKILQKKWRQKRKKRKEMRWVQSLVAEKCK